MDDLNQLGPEPSPGAGGQIPPPGSMGWEAAPSPPTPSLSGTDLGGYQPPPGSGGFGGYQPPPPDFGGPSGGGSRHRAGRWAAVGAAAVVILGGIGVGGYELGSANSKPASTIATEPVPSPASSSNSNTGTSAKVDVSKIVSQVDPGVVDITSTDSYTGAVDAGTGMVLTSSGEVLTNNHVIAGGTSIVAQVDGTGAKYTAKVVGTDPTQDVALLQLQNASGMSTVKMGNSSTVTVGEPVVAIGNALALPGPPTVTEGIISALNRSITATDSGTGTSEHLVGLFQTDAPLSPGNSGGPLINSQGQVIAMNTAAATGSGGENASNIGFSIPINEALSIASQIQKGQASSRVEIGYPAFLGVSVENIPSSSSSSGGFFGGGFGYTAPVSSGALVTQVVPGTPAAQAGLVAGDVITSFGGQAISSVSGLRSAIDADHPGQSTTIGWVTSSDTKGSATVTLISGPPA